MSKILRHGWQSIAGFVVVASLIPPPARAQSGGVHPQAAPVANAVRLTGNVSVDGKLDEEVWRTATPITEFRQSQPDEGKPGTQRTEIRFAYDDAALYIGAKMFDSLGGKGVVTRLLRRDALAEDEETASRVFEPFFTTKEVGKGTGLGFSMVYGFVKQSGGHVKIYSELGHGTTVKVYLPRLLGSVDDEIEPADVLVPEGTAAETVLVCEDDDEVRAYSVEVLRELGYRVLEAHDGPSALRLLERQEGRVDLLFSDVVLPGGMSGADLATKARALRPNLKVLFTTGYARDAIVHHGRLDSGVELITKPFAYAELAARVRDLIDAEVPRDP